MFDQINSLHPQGPALHVLVSVTCPGHPASPGVPPVHVLVRVSTPCPQLAEQLLNRLHWPQTTCKKYSKLGHQFEDNNFFNKENKIYEKEIWEQYPYHGHM